MEPAQIWIAVIVSAVALGAHGAYYGALADACLKIGTGLDGMSKGTTGFQDAITPPESVNARLINWVVTIIIMFVSWKFLGVAGLSCFIVIRLLTSVLGGSVMKSTPPKKHYCRRIYRSVARREADFVKSSDQLRADAMRDIRLRYERSPFANQL